MTTQSSPTTDARRAANVLLIGLRAAGKTTIGTMLATRIGREFVDLDLDTAAQLGKPTAAAALRDAGEPTFRAAEVDCLRHLLAARAEGGRVIALGGGTPTAPGASDLLIAAARSGTALVVYLRLPASTLRERLRQSHPDSRPSLTGRGTVEEVDDLHAARDPLYRRLATHTIEADGLSPDAIAEHILGLLP